MLPEEPVGGRVVVGGALRAREVEAGDADAAALVAPHVEARAVDQELREARLEREQRARRQGGEDARQGERDALLGVEDAHVAQLDRRHPAARLRARWRRCGSARRAWRWRALRWSDATLRCAAESASEVRANPRTARATPPTAATGRRARSIARASTAPVRRCGGKAGGTGGRDRRHEDSVAPDGQCVAMTIASSSCTDCSDRHCIDAPRRSVQSSTDPGRNDGFPDRRLASRDGRTRGNDS